MKTDELITMLASGATAVEANSLRRRYAMALGWGAFGAMLIMTIMLGVRPDLAEAALLPMFWIKLAFPVVLVAGSLLAATRLSRPGIPLGHAVAVIAAPVIAMVLLAVAALMGAAPGERDGLIFGETWASCPFNIATISAPLLVASLWSMQGLAPTRLALSGGAAGLLAGAGGALVYSLHCPEMGAPFIAIWYVLGMLIPTVLGAVLGPRLLRW